MAPARYVQIEPAFLSKACTSWESRKRSSRSAPSAPAAVRVTRVVLEIGKSCADPARLDPVLLRPLQRRDRRRGGELEITRDPRAGASAASAEAEVSLEQPFGTCACGSTDLEWLSGEEIKIKEMEVV